MLCNLCIVICRWSVNCIARITKAPCTLLGKIWKRRFHSHWRRIEWFLSTQRRAAPDELLNYHWSFSICVWEKLGQENFMIIVKPSFWLQTGGFKFLRFEERFWKAPFSLSNCRNKAALIQISPAYCERCLVINIFILISSSAFSSCSLNALFDHMATLQSDNTTWTSECSRVQLSQLL